MSASPSILSSWSLSAGGYNINNILTWETRPPHNEWLRRLCGLATVPLLIYYGLFSEVNCRLLVICAKLVQQAGTPVFIQLLFIQGRWKHVLHTSWTSIKCTLCFVFPLLQHTKDKSFLFHILFIQDAHQYPGYPSHYWYPQSHSTGHYANTYPTGSDVQPQYSPQVHLIMQCILYPLSESKKDLNHSLS